MAPRHSSRFSRSRDPFAASSTPPRHKYVFPLVNTPVRRSRENCENFPPDNASADPIPGNHPVSGPFSEIKFSPSVTRSSSKPKPASNLSSSLPARNPVSRLPSAPPLHAEEASAGNSTAATTMATTLEENDNLVGNAKRRLNLEAPRPAKESAEHDHGVNIMVRIRPGNPKEATEEATEIIEKISENSLRLCDHQFTFDRIAEEDTSQQGMFKMVGLPFVENCLKGFNSSLFTYGQTGSGKTYTMWGPTEGLIQRSNEERGLAPRVFEYLFHRINEEEAKHKAEQFSYQCRCSFLEIYNEQITDLLEPSQRNLQIREDTKVGVYVENLSEEFVSRVEDIFSVILKGLANRKIGSTSMNSDSSRSHTVFICTIESRCKSANGVSCIKTSRMNLVDLAGSERQKSTRAAGQRLKEAGNINRSLSQLGNVINILAEMSQTGKPRHIPYRDSRLTFLLQESLGGNAKLAVICTISPMSSCKNETLSTLRFAQRAKAIKNEATVNEKTEDEVQSLREQIRQLKDELMKMKNEIPSNVSGNANSVWNARRSYNLLRMSLKRSMVLPHIESDSDEDMEFEDAEDGSYVSPLEDQDEVLISSDKKGRPWNESDAELNAQDSECRASKKGRLLDGSDNPTSPTCVSELIPSDAVEEGATDIEMELLQPRLQQEDGDNGSSADGVLASSQFATTNEIPLPQTSDDAPTGDESVRVSECYALTCHADAKQQIQVAETPSSSSFKNCLHGSALSISSSFQEASTTSLCIIGSDITSNAGTVAMKSIEIDQSEQPEALNSSFCGGKDNRSFISSITGPDTSLGLGSSDLCECDTLYYDADATEVMQTGASPNSSILKDGLQVPTLCVSPRVQEVKKSAPCIVSASTSNVQALPNKPEKSRPVHRSLCVVDNTNIFPMQSKSLSSPTERLAASLYRGLQILENHQKRIANNRASYTTAFSLQNPCRSVVDKSVQTSPMMFPSKSESLQTSISLEVGLPNHEAVGMAEVNAIAIEKRSIGTQYHEDDPLICMKDPVMSQEEYTNREQTFEDPGTQCPDDHPLIGACHDEYTNQEYKFEDPCTMSQCHRNECDRPTCAMTATQDPTIGSQSDELQSLKVLLAGALRRESAAEEALNRKNIEIENLNRLVNQYKHERGCNAVLQESGEIKMARLQNLLEGTIPTEAFMNEQLVSLMHEHKILQGKYASHPDVTLANLSQQRLNEELEKYQNFYDRGEREELIKEISQLKKQLQDSLEKTKDDESASQVAVAMPEEESYPKFMFMISELRMRIEDYKRIAEEKEKELEGEQRCATEMKEALQVAMEGHARLLDQYAELQEKHVGLLAKHRKMREAIADARKKGGKMGCFRGKWFEAQAAELAAIKVEQEQERKRAKEQIEELQAQVHDTADAVQAAGELLVRLREAYESVLVAEDAAELAVQDAEKLHRENERLKRKHSTEIATLQQRLMEARFQKTTVCPMCLMAERVKFQFPEVNAEEAQAAMEAEQLAAEEDDRYEFHSHEAY